MADPFDLDVVSPESVILNGQADHLIVRTTAGEIEFLPGHIPFVGVLVPAPMRIQMAGGDHVVYAVHSGFVEVSGGHATVLTDTAELASEIDTTRAQAALERADAALAADDEDEDAAEAKKRAQVRLAVAGAT